MEIPTPTLNTYTVRYVGPLGKPQIVHGAWGKATDAIEAAKADATVDGIRIDTIWPDGDTNRHYFIKQADGSMTPHEVA